MARQALDVEQLARVSLAIGRVAVAGWVEDGAAWRIWQWVDAHHRHGWYNRVTGEHGPVVGCPPESGRLCHRLFGRPAPAREEGVLCHS